MMIMKACLLVFGTFFALVGALSPPRCGGPSNIQCAPGRKCDKTGCGPKASGAQCDFGVCVAQSGPNDMKKHCPRGRGVRIVSREFPSCQSRKFKCKSGTERFNIPGCGCGCKPEKNKGNMPSSSRPTCPPARKGIRAYASKDPTLCSRLAVDCKPGYWSFSNRCGCGCVRFCPVAGKDVIYTFRGRSSKQRMKKCSNIQCNKGFKPFKARCGCGCIRNKEQEAEEQEEEVEEEEQQEQQDENVAPHPSSSCPPQSRDVKYKSKKIARCNKIRRRIKCPRGFRVFFNKKCGCGCRRLAILTEPPEPKFDWSTLIGIPCDEAKAKIEESDPSLHPVCISQKSPITADYSPTRVRIIFDEDGNVVDTPRQG